jgi:hypothetical protein
MIAPKNRNGSFSTGIKLTLSEGELATEPHRRTQNRAVQFSVIPVKTGIHL